MSRKGYWGFMSIHYAIQTFLVASLVVFYFDTHKDELAEAAFFILLIYYVATFLPCLSAQIRRYRDAGKSWYWLFIPIANFMFLLYPQATETTEMISCYKCGSKNVKDAKFCNNCGVELNVQRHCPKCNTVSDNASIYCSQCGEKI